MPTLAEVGADGREGHEVSLHVHLLAALGEHLLKGARKEAAKPASHELSSELRQRAGGVGVGGARAETHHRTDTSDVSCKSWSTLSTILV